MAAETADVPFHIGIASPNVSALKDVLGPLLGLTWVSLSRPAVVHHTPTGPMSPSSQVIWSQQGSPHIELVKSEPGSVYDPARGTHVHHFGYWTSDLSASLVDYQSRGWQIEATLLDEEGRPAAFAYLSRPGEVWVELVEESNRVRLEAELWPAHAPA